MQKTSTRIYIFERRRNIRQRGGGVCGPANRIYSTEFIPLSCLPRKPVGHYSCSPLPSPLSRHPFPLSLFLRAVVTHRRFLRRFLFHGCRSIMQRRVARRDADSKFRLEVVSRVSANQQASTVDFAIPEREREKERGNIERLTRAFRL